MVVEQVEVGGQARVPIRPALPVQIHGRRLVAVAFPHVLQHGRKLFLGFNLRGFRGRQRLAGSGRPPIIHRGHRPREKGVGRQAIRRARPRQGHGAGQRLQGRRQRVARGRVPLHHRGQRGPGGLHGACARQRKL